MTISIFMARSGYVAKVGKEEGGEYDQLTVLEQREQKIEDTFQTQAKFQMLHRTVA
jgi:hypothetical protein